MLFSVLMCLHSLAGQMGKQKALTSNPHVAIEICLTARRIVVPMVYGCQICLELEAK